jgi:hypothetical protein
MKMASFGVINVRSFVFMLVLCLLYVLAVEVIARWVLHGRDPRIAEGELHGFVEDIWSAPPLARWDSVWYYGIAVGGYEGNRNKAGFLPLYPLMMRVASRAFGVDPFVAGLWISRVAMLIALSLLVEYTRSIRSTELRGLSPSLILLTFPSAFILISVYSESLFLATTLAAFVLARRGHPWLAAVAAFAAGMTRIHGLALLPALAALGWSQWRAEERSLASFAPAAGVAAAYACISLYFSLAFGDPLRYFSAKREGFNTRFSLPWETLERSFTRFDYALARDTLEALYIGLEVPCLWILIIASYRNFMLRCWPELVFLAGGAMMSLCAGSLWGLPRFVLCFFPIYTVLSELHRWRVVWWIFLICNFLLQVANLVQYVNFGLPAP